MYHDHFGLVTEPFGVTPDARFFFLSEQHVEASASLYYAVAQRRGFAVLVGQPGLGKTSVLVNLAERIAGEARVAFLVHPHLSGSEVLGSVLLAMGLEPASNSVERLRQFHNFLLDLSRQGKTCLVIIDEAQNLGFEALETIRMLSNFEAPTHKLIQFILAGQPALEDLLRRPEAEQILQRVNSITRLHPLSEKQLGDYIAHRLSVAGRQEKLFTPAALRVLAEASGGIPRNVNTLCFNALTLAFAEGKKTIDADCIAQTASERFAESPRPAVSASVPASSFNFSGPARYRPSRALITAALTLLTLVCAGVILGLK
jgi:general secretion pathway protein A